MIKKPLITKNTFTPMPPCLATSAQPAGNPDEYREWLNNTNNIAIALNPSKEGMRFNCRV
ncbi:hypothetical protein GCM10007352_24010 [Mucilaginibacter phyllosphaerae]|nr:hypothetical protein GCM10007352_24010 [Mucilaginibacter phyllosphaerae]